MKSTDFNLSIMTRANLQKKDEQGLSMTDEKVGGGYFGRGIKSKLIMENM